jgi:hypothetical protein
LVPKVSLQGSEDRFKRSARIVAAEILHVLQQERGWPVLIKNSCDCEEKIALISIGKSMTTP